MVNIQIPQHIAIIMDGNGRWARAKGRPRIFGHRAGAKRAREIIERAASLKIKALTLYAFSTENWQRPKNEIELLMELFLSSLKNETAKLHQNNINLKIIGGKDKFSKKLQTEIQNAENLTQNNSGMALNVAANYGGRWDIVMAVKKLVLEVADGKISANEINEASISNYLSTCNLPEPDLLIRTGGDVRISNFLIWQIAYSELYFTHTNWPDFNSGELDKAIKWYSKRERKFGKTSKQIKNSHEF